jgi:dienelactone hydrolase
MKLLRAVAALLAAIGCSLASGAADRREPVTFIAADGTPVPAYLVRPEGNVKGTVIALHGCGGLYFLRGSRAGQLLGRHEAMAQLLVARGYAVLFPDSFMARGEFELCTQQLQARSMGPAERRTDTLAAVDWVAAQPWARADRIALLGWSQGGSTVLAATNASRPDVREQRVKPALAVAFYPGCNAALRANYTAAVPLTLFLGEKDDWTPAAPCIELAKRSGAEVHVYPDAWHGFDNPDVPTVRLRTDVPNGANPGQGVHVGLNAAARDAAYKRLLEALHKVFE